MRKDAAPLLEEKTRFCQKHPLLCWIVGILSGLLLLFLFPWFFPPSFPAGLPREVNVNNIKSPYFSHDFFALDGQFYYLQDGFYNMGVYRSTGQTAKRIFRSSDFSTREGDQYGRLGDIFPCGDKLYFELYPGDGKSNFYVYDPANGSFQYLFHLEAPRFWIVHDRTLIYQKYDEQERKTNAFHHDTLWIYDLDSGKQTRIADDVEDIGLVDGTLYYVSFLGDCLREPDGNREKGYRLVYDGEYAYSSYDFSTGETKELGRFPLIFEPDLYYTNYDVFSFTGRSVAMLSFDRQYRNELVVYTPGQDDLQIISAPLPIQKLVAAGNVAFALLYEDNRYDSQQGLYRFDLINGTVQKLGKGTYLPDISSVDMYVAAEDSIFLIQGHPWLFGSWRKVMLIDPNSGAVLRRYRI